MSLATTAPPRARRGCDECQAPAGRHTWACSQVPLKTFVAALEAPAPRNWAAPLWIAYAAVATTLAVTTHTPMLTALAGACLVLAGAWRSR